MSVVVEVSARKFSIPDACACCAAAPQVQLSAAYTRRTGKRVIHETTRSLDFPYCQRCAAHANKWRSAPQIFGTLFTFGMVLGIAVAAGKGGDAGGATFVVMSIMSIVAFVRARSQARKLCGPACVGPEPAVQHLGWSGSVSSFSFRSTGYAVRFGAANARNLINVSMGLRRLLDEHAAASPVQLAVHVQARSIPAPAAAQPLARPTGDLVLEWIARIEGYKGPEARRGALKRALAEIHEPHPRRELMLAATRIEVAAVLDKVDALSSSAAKKRHLQKAIADLRADTIPYELQAELLLQLDARLRDLG